MIGIRHFISLIGSIAGAAAGWLLGGWVGAVVGYLAAAIAIGIPVTLYEEWLVRRWRERKHGWLAPFFGEYQGPEKEDEWGRTKEELGSGEDVQGVVVHKEHGYVYADIGCGFPAILSVKHVPGQGALGHPPETWDSLLPEPGQAFEARIRRLNHLEREVKLTQCETDG